MKKIIIYTFLLFFIVIYPVNAKIEGYNIYKTIDIGTVSLLHFENNTDINGINKVLNSSYGNSFKTSLETLYNDLISSPYPYRYIFFEKNQYGYINITGLSTDTPIKLYRTQDGRFYYVKQLNSLSSQYILEVYEYKNTIYNKYENVRVNNLVECYFYEFNYYTANAFVVNDQIVDFEKLFVKSQDLNNFIKITMPSENYQTTLKTISYLITYNMKDVDLIEIKNKDGSEIDGEKEIITNEYNSETGEGFLNFVVTYHNIGEKDIRVRLISGEQYIETTRKIKIIAFTDANNDGKDDTTGEKYDYYFKTSEEISKINENSAPKREDYEEGIIGSVQYGFDKLFYYIKLPFSLLGQALKQFYETIENFILNITGFSQLISKTFVFIPSEIQSMINITIIVLIIISIMKFMRG